MDELAAEYGFSYTVSTAGIDEKAIREPDPRALVVALAHAKADAIIARLRSGDEVGAGRRGVLITCDQVVVHMGRILEKPEDEAQASQRRQRCWRRRRHAHAVQGPRCLQCSILDALLPSSAQAMCAHSHRSTCLRGVCRRLASTLPDTARHLPPLSAPCWPRTWKAGGGSRRWTSLR